MNSKNPLYDAIGIDANNQQSILTVAKKIGVSSKELDYYNNNNILPDNKTLNLIHEHLNIQKEEIMLRMGIFNSELKKIICDNASEIIKTFKSNKDIISNHQEVYESDLGKLYQGDCLSLLSTIADDSFDLIFADPPFNLNKLYPSAMNDNLTKMEYIHWTELWIDECIRTLKRGGSFFLWNIPKWNTYFSDYLNERLLFRNWIATDIKFSLPIQGRLYPSHYSLLYYVKGEKPNTFHPDRLPMETCRKCHGDIKDYGGYKDKMNPNGINITDVWYDIPPVRHAKNKGRKDANELSIKLLDRIIEMSSNPGDLIFDPFGGSGTTYIVSEIKKRNWIGIELGPVNDIIRRFESIKNEEHNLLKFRDNYNNLFPSEIKEKRILNGLWTDESIRLKKINNFEKDLFSDVDF